MRNEACRAHAEGRQSAQLFDQRTACLDQRRASLAATVDVVHGTGQVGVDERLKAVAGLPSLATCADSEALTAALPLPGAELRPQVQQHRETLARVEVLEQTGQLRLGMQLVDEVLADSRTAAYAPLIAEANYHKGSLQQWEGAPAKALEAYERALWSAIEIDHALVAARASQRRGFVLAYQLLQPVRAREGLELMTALNRRVRHNVAAYAEYLDNTAVVRLKLDETDEAARLWQEAIALREEHGLLETAAGIGGLYNFAMVLQLQKRCEEALPLYRRVVALSEKTLGASEPQRPLYEMAVAVCLVELGRPHEARERMQQLERSLDRFETDRARKYGFFGRAYAELAAGDGDAARQYISRALAAVPEEVLPEFWALLAMAAALAGDPPAVERAREKALAGLQGSDPRQSSSQVVHKNVGKALASLGRHEEAIAVFVTARDALADATGSVDRLRRDMIALELGKSRTALGQFDAAEQDLEAALTGFQAELTPRNRELADAMLALGELALARQRFEAATTWLAEAEAVYAGTAEPDYPPLVRTRAALAEARTRE
ncbi:tetratricopeptide repeat protein [Nannocystis pusilla]|uniref:tetratricopeptide repeat protein n=1 Tax=Nannocystis pusilla TaxID=889268 RepID=UPI003DA4B10A